MKKSALPPNPTADAQPSVAQQRFTYTHNAEGNRVSRTLGALAMHEDKLSEPLLPHNAPSGKKEKPATEQLNALLAERLSNLDICISRIKPEIVTEIDADGHTIARFVYPEPDPSEVSELEKNAEMCQVEENISLLEDSLLLGASEVDMSEPEKKTSNNEADTTLYETPVLLEPSTLNPSELKKNTQKREQQAKMQEATIETVAETGQASDIVVHSIDENRPVGRISYQEDVSPTGGKTVSIPILTTPAPFVPQVALTYNSQAGNGVAGFGWNIAGISAISAVSRNIHFDGVAAPIDMVNQISNAFTLDGVRLVPINNPHGVTGFHYETAQGFVVVRRFTSDNIITGFEALYPDGSTAFFGNSQPNSTRYIYPLQWRMDKNGNMIHFEYEFLGNSNMFFIRRIRYGARFNVLQSYPSEILFTYSNRVDFTPQYIAGTRILQNRILTDITSINDGQEIRTYQLSYQMEGDMNRLVRIDCSATTGGRTLNPLTFDYPFVPPRTFRIDGWFPLERAFPSSVDPNSQPHYIRGKMLGGNFIDGLLTYPRFEMYKQLLGSPTGHIFGSGYPPRQNLLIYPEFEVWPRPITIQAEEGFQLLNTVDVDGDGVDEIVKVNFGPIVQGRTTLVIKTYKITPSTPTSTPPTITMLRNFSVMGANSVVTSGRYTSPMSMSYYFGDFIGNGRTQLLVVSHNRTPFNELRGSLFTLINLNSGTIISQLDIPGFEHPISESPFVHTFDVDGDGKTELCHASSRGLNVYAFDVRSSAFQLMRPTDHDIARSYFTDSRARFGDLNGDGKLDIIVPPLPSANNQWICFLNTGKGFERTIQQITNVGANDRIMLIDMNRDGCADLIHIRNNQMRLHLNVRGRIESTSNNMVSVDPRTALLPVNVVNSSNSSALISILDHWVDTYYFSRDESKDNLMLAMRDSYGLTSRNFYDNMVGKRHYHLGRARTYPFATTIFPLQLLTDQTTFNSDGSRLNNQTYNYRGAVMHQLGLGFCGFERVDTRDNIANMTFQEHRDPEMLGVVTDIISPLGTKSYTWQRNADSHNRRVNPRVSWHNTVDAATEVTVFYHYTYDSFNNPISTHMTNWHTMSFAIQTIQTYENITTQARYIIGQPLTKTVQKQNWVTGEEWTDREVIAYNAHRLPQSLTTFTGASVANNRTGEARWTYDVNGNILTEFSSSIFETRATDNVYTYDPSGRYMATVRNVDGHLTTFSYFDRYGNAQTITDHRGRATRRVFDEWGQPIRTTYPDEAVETITAVWDEQGVYRVETQITGQPSVIVHYDGVDRVLRESNLRFDGTWQHIDYAYNTKGLLDRVSLPHKGSSALWNQYRYDFFNRPIELNEASDKTTTWEYQTDWDIVGWWSFEIVTRVIETRDGISSTRTSDWTGRLVAAADSGGTTRYILRPDGQPEAIVAPGDVITGFGYDAFGRQISINDPSAGVRTFSSVQTTGITMRTIRDASGREITTTFDRTGRIRQVVRPEFNTLYRYDEDGLLTNVFSLNNTTVAYTYDELDRLATVRENGLNGVFLEKAFTYANEGSNVETICYTARSGVIGTEKYIYANGYNTEVKFNNTLFWRLTAENELGQPTAATTGPLLRTYSYTPFGMPTGRTAGNIQNFASSFDVHKGNLTSRRDNKHNKTETFGYDHLNRLSNTPAGTTTYTPNGNITQMGSMGAMEYTNAQRPYQITRFTPVSNNVVPMRNQQATFTSFQRPNTITENGVTANFDYDGGGERVRMTVTQGAATLLTRHYIGRQYEQDVQANIERLYLGGDAYSAPAVLIREGVGGLWNIHYLCRDYLGSITHITNGSGNVRQELSYDAWGRLRDPNNQVLFAPGSEPSLLLGRGFTGHEHLPWFGLINCNARLYDPAVGRFLSPDPFVQNPLFSQNYNRYSYCWNNPLKYVDEEGESITLSIIGIGLIVGAAINVISNWDNIRNGWQALAFAGVGAIGGGLAAKFPGAGKWIAAGTGAANNLLRQSFDPYTQGICWQQVGFSGIMSGVTAWGGAKLGNAIGADRLFGNIKSPLLREVSQNVTTNAVIGGGFGALDAWAHGENVWQGARGGIRMGIVTGTITGIGNAAKHSIQHNVGMITGRDRAIMQAHYSVYHGLDAALDVRYVGMTGRDPYIRYGEHLNSGTNRAGLDFDLVPNGTGLTKTNARIMEQNLINQYGLQRNGGQLYNRRNAIAPRHWSRFGIRF